jgi:hypothetical protein
VVSDQYAYEWIEAGIAAWYAAYVGEVMVGKTA